MSKDILVCMVPGDWPIQGKFAHLVTENKWMNMSNSKQDVSVIVMQSKLCSIMGLGIKGQKC